LLFVKKKAKAKEKQQISKGDKKLFRIYEMSFYKGKNDNNLYFIKKKHKKEKSFLFFFGQTRK